MMWAPAVERLWEEASQALSMGHLPRAVECLRQVLSIEPNFSEAHALLSLCLIDMKRISAAEVEADIALNLDASSAIAHRARAQVFTAQRRFSEAEEHYRRLLDMSPMDDSYHREYGELLDMAGRSGDAEGELIRALELEPNEPDNFTALGSFRLNAGQVEEAERYAEPALSLSPRHLDALVLMGRIALRKGDVDKAREHAHWALGIDATNGGALRLIASIKAKTNWFLGLWWRYGTWCAESGSQRVVVVLLVAFVVYRVSRQLLSDSNNDQAAGLVDLAWIGACIYTWVGPSLFQREVQKELGQVQLRDDF